MEVVAIDPRLTVPSEVAPWTPQTAGTVCASNKYDLPLSLRSGSLATSFKGGENK